MYFLANPETEFEITVPILRGSRAGLKNMADELKPRMTVHTTLKAIRENFGPPNAGTDGKILLQGKIISKTNTWIMDVEGSVIAIICNTPGVYHDETEMPFTLCGSQLACTLISGILNMND